jgi:Disulphide bond corrector protein DsbC
MKKINLACLVLVLFAGLTVAAAQNAASRTFVSFEPMSTVHVRPGKPTPVAFHFHVTSGYHINSNKPTTPELIPTAIHFSLPGELVVGRVEYPAGQLTSFPFDPQQKLSVYSGDVLIKAVVLSTADAGTGTYTVHAELKYQACDNNACYPPKKLPVTFNVNVGAGGKRSGAKARPTKTSPHIHSN